MTAPLETIEDSLLQLLHIQLAKSGLLGTDRALVVSEEAEVAKAARNPPVIIIRYASGALGAAETTSRYGVVCWGDGSYRQKRSLSYTALVITTRLRNRSGRRGDVGTYALLNEIDLAWSGRTPERANHPLFWASDSVLEIEGLPDTVLIHGVTYETQAYFTSYPDDGGIRGGEDGDRGGESDGRGGGA